MPVTEFLPDSDALEGLAWYAQRKPVYTGGNTVQLLRGGDRLFPAMAAAIDAAQSHVWMAMYIISPDGHSDLVLQALMRAAKRGVTVHLVVDGVGSRSAPPALWRTLGDAGVNVATFRPLTRWWRVFDATQWRRMHMKLCSVDRTCAFVGGINLIDDRLDLQHGWSKTPRLDYAVSVQGPTVVPVEHTVRAMWMRAAFGRDDLAHWVLDPHRVRRLREWWRNARLRLTPEEQLSLRQGAASPHPVQAAFVVRDNLRQRRTIERASVQAIHQARHHIDIITPYFYPGRALRLAIRQAAQRGVTVRLLLQGKIDYRIAGLAARVLYEEMQRDGVQIFEYEPAFLHAKVLRVDDDWATIGSSNLDPLSLVVNLEANLLVRDRAFVAKLSASLAEDFAASRAVPMLNPDVPPSLSTRLGRTVVSRLAKTYLRLAGMTGRY